MESSAKSYNNEKEEVIMKSMFESPNAITYMMASIKIEPSTLVEESKDDQDITSQFFIRDTITGAMYDLRSEAFCSGAYIDPSFIHEDSLAKRSELDSQLLYASELGDLEGAKNSLDPLLNGGWIADINARELNDFTPLHNTASEGHSQLMNFLLEKGADVNAVTTGGRTALHLACYNGNKEIIEQLVSYGSNINLQENEGNTPIHILSEYGWTESLSSLLKLNPDLTIKNNCGLTAPEVSANIEIRELFPLSKEVVTGYKRTAVDSLILHNSRADMVKSLMFRNKLLAKTPIDSQKEEIKVKMKPSEKEKRRLKLIEATRRIKDIIIIPENCKPAGPEDFQPIRPLGKGSFGQVYLVKHKPSGKLYAMKILDKEKFMSKNIMKYALAERNVMSCTRHPFIVGLRFTFQTSEKLFLVLDYCPGY